MQVRPRVFIANFGRENYLWPDCLARSTVATVEDEDLRPFSLANDKQGYITHCRETKKTARGLTPTVPVASRWFNLAPIVSSTDGDVWIHREKDELWWTVSGAKPVEVALKPSYAGARQAGANVFEIHKPAETWSNKNKRGVKLVWNALHARAREFLFTEGTLQELSKDNAEYALALIDGDPLDTWHAQASWKARADRAKHGAVTVFDAKQRTFVMMAKTALETTRGANGQQVLRTVKNKEFRFASQQALERYVADMFESQEGLCAITGLGLHLHEEDADADLVCSLDRIDSAGHYEEGNLQIVCRFVNRWKSDGDDANFRRLVELVRGTG